MNKYVSIALVFCGIAVISMSGLTIFRKEISVARLRILDTVMMSAGVLVIGIWASFWLSSGAQGLGYLPKELELLLARKYWLLIDGKRILLTDSGPPLVASLQINYSMVAVLYGVLVPNTWRRCALMLLMLPLSAAAVVMISTIGNPTLKLYLPKMLFASVSIISIFSIVALYGCHKLDVSRKQSFVLKQVGQYRLLRRLGRGGMGEVFLASHKLLRRPCAIKMLRSEQAGSMERLERFEREVQAMALLTHPNTVEIYDYGHTNDGTFYYVMEFLPGVGLDQLVRHSGALPAGRVLWLLHQVLGALHEAHSQGLIHRDVKPGNIIACMRGGQYDVAKLLDFGLVQVAGLSEVSPSASTEVAPSSLSKSASSRLTQVGHILGTPGYLSPEQARGEEADVRSDIYSVGCVGYYLLTGQPPFSAASIVELYEAHISKLPVPPRQIRSEVPAEVEAVILRCLEKDPAARFQSARELAAAFAACPAATEWRDEQAQRWWVENQDWLRQKGALSTTEPLNSVGENLDEEDGTDGTLTSMQTVDSMPSGPARG